MTNYNYNEIEGYWNFVYGQVPKFTVDTKIPYPEIMDGIRWIGEQANHVLDFGCGNGKALVVASKYGVKSGVGIDLSKTGIETANQVVAGSRLEDHFEFTQGGIEALAAYEADTFDGVILFNTLDNLHPEDGKALIEELERVMKKGAALLLKLNPVYEDDVFTEENEFQKIDDKCYKEESGLLFWNMDDEVLNALFEGKFEYVNGYDIDMAEFDTVNRMYWLKKV